MLNDVSPFEEETVDMVEQMEPVSDETEREVVEQNEKEELEESEFGYKKQIE